MKIYDFVETALGGVGKLILMSTQLFPMIDPFLILLFVQGYIAFVLFIPFQIFWINVQNAKGVYAEHL